ncbi:MAG: DNA mismatch repair endonuclease MutL [Deltaproteobacteria bacterium]|nr:DNA mismatch repair endonuclease MutL [Deltaproteobacteria bacterium]
MSRVRILPEILSNKIAAGEVVERPASVVKELVENALDAGATRILIDIEQGGRAMVRVADNGSGMLRDDALLSIERYATSKIHTDEDLFRIRTLGFRGEALPSIAAVSRFSLVTREASADSGTEVVIEGGKLVSAAETGAAPGTMVTVRQLFFNTPARRKFLKAIATEMAHISDIVAGMALAWPQAQFRLTHNGRIVKDWPAASDPFDRVVEVLGAGYRGELHPIGLSLEEVSVGGWVSSPRVHRKSAGGIFVFVNNRHVRDRVVQHALFQGYFQRLVKGQFPLAALFIRIPFDQVDVNVHPTKTEVRFARSNGVYEAVRRAVAQTVYDVDRPSWKPAGFPETVKQGGMIAEDRLEFGGRGSEGCARTSEGGRAAWDENRKGAFSPEDRGWKPLPQRTQNTGISHSGSDVVGEASSLDDRGKMPLPQKMAPLQGREDTNTRHPASSLSPQATRLQAEIWEKRGFAGLRVIGQLHNTYILCEAEDGLVLIDQHAAHERVLYEQLGRGGRMASQALFVPETVDLGFREAQVLETLLPALRGIGLDAEPFGGNTVVVKSVPAVLVGRELRPLIVEIAEAAAAAGAAAPLGALDRCRQIAACHGAIRARQALSIEEMQALLRQMDECTNSSHCPHGRPTWLRYDAGVIERAFKRTL